MLLVKATQGAKAARGQPQATQGAKAARGRPKPAPRAHAPEVTFLQNKRERELQQSTFNILGLPMPFLRIIANHFAPMPPFHFLVYTI
ncbi:hypothetical protein [Paenibacillus lentus]|uniref:Uncharacterized protein n=1 Tax=Paenibacillus lentus TaxID=1338368 RepID=A0A3Q8S9V0_9BACL|nr:hypothetical protein [Paenibacillus lentus]AZK45743.1 hypothetical protein EIM92_05575 [Paenibacillus lentus]